MKINLNNLSKQLKVVKRAQSTVLSDKEIFIDLITRFEQCWNSSNAIYDQFKITLIEYEEPFFNLIEDLLLVNYGEWKTEIILWYIYGRVDENGKIYSLVIKEKGQDEEEIVLNNPDELWDFLQKLETNRNKDK